MFAVKAIYDGTTFKPVEPISVDGEYEVIITFVEPVKPDAQKPRRRYLLEPDPSKSFKLGLREGEMKIPDDFKEPLDEMKEYMY
ncbi:MAG: hypothetical protein FWB74_01505 [Defluviitaleaceae bacterium]|nr:hypothetical protein [Defluviitaleaceae bacterium]